MLAVNACILTKSQKEGQEGLRGIARGAAVMEVEMHWVDPS